MVLLCSPIIRKYCNANVVSLSSKLFSSSMAIVTLKMTRQHHHEHDQRRPRRLRVQMIRIVGFHCCTLQDTTPVPPPRPHFVFYLSTTAVDDLSAGRSISSSNVHPHTELCCTHCCLMLLLLYYSAVEVSLANLCFRARELSPLQT